MELCRLKVPTICIAAFFETVTTLVGCYLLALANGHVPAWLPMISDCGVYAPEKYPFRLGVVIGCCLMAGQMALVYYGGKPYSGSTAALILSSVGSFSLSIAAVVSEQENSTLHGAAAGVFFALYEANMVVLTWVLPQEDDTTRPAIFWSRVVREVCAVGNGIGLLAFGLLSIDRSTHKVYLALVEWIGTFLCLLFNLSYSVDLSDRFLAESTPQEKVVLEDK